tara:strand:- start:990 stop:1409 length:420 start_codon:yes stop_codon:yes gene_type:complete
MSYKNIEKGKKSYKNKDLEFGFQSEDDTLFRIKEVFGADIEKTGMYDTFDFENEEYMIELKTRRIHSKQYPDLMIGLQKLEIAETANKKCIILWKLTDGLFMWECNRDDYTVRMGGRTDRGRDERRFMAFIPMNILKKI